MNREARERLKDFGASVVDRAKTNVGAYRRVKGRQIRRVSTMALKNSLSYSINDNGKGKVTLKFFAKGPAAKYAAVIEDGRRPGKKAPPIDVIEKWIADKPLRMRDTKTGAFVKTTPARVRSAAFLIARSIGKKGIMGIKFFEEALNNEIEDRGDDYFTDIADTIVAAINTEKN